MRTRSSMGKMVNKLTNREKNDAFLMIDRIARGVSHPYTKEFVPTVVASSHNIKPATSVVRESAFRVEAQTNDNVVIMRTEPKKQASQPKIVFPDVFYEYFEIIENQPQKVG